MLRTSKFVNREFLQFYQRWLEYIPDIWEVDILLAKKASDLSDTELDRLKLIREGKKASTIIKKYLAKVEEIQGDNQPDNLCELILTSEDYIELESTLNSFDLEHIALIKLSESELRRINNIIALYDGSNESDIIETIQQLESIYTRDYANYLLKKKVAKKYSQKIENKMLKNKRGYKLKYRKTSNRRKKY